MTNVERLEAIPREMADAIKVLLPSIDRDAYLRYLDMMFHYTRRSGERLSKAAASTRVPALADFFQQLADEEHGHYRLAEADLAAFDRKPSEREPHEVSAFHNTWESLVDAGRVGALVALESVGEHLQVEAPAALGRLGLGRDQARFILVHLQVDAEHGARSREQARALWAAEAPRIVGGAERAAERWIAMHRRALGQSPR